MRESGGTAEVRRKWESRRTRSTASSATWSRGGRRGGGERANEGRPSTAHFRCSISVESQSMDTRGDWRTRRTCPCVHPSCPRPFRSHLLEQKQQAETASTDNGELEGSALRHEVESLRALQLRSANKQPCTTAFRSFRFFRTPTPSLHAYTAAVTVLRLRRLTGSSVSVIRRARSVKPPNLRPLTVHLLPRKPPPSRPSRLSLPTILRSQQRYSASPSTTPHHPASTFHSSKPRLLAFILKRKRPAFSPPSLPSSSSNAASSSLTGTEASSITCSW
jgi:hypothetical protein